MDDRSISDLVTRARNGDQRAWDGLVERYAPLVWSICHRYELSRADADDVQQTVWLQLVSQLDKIRDPDAFPPGRGGQPAGKRDRIADLVQLAHEL